MSMDVKLFDDTQYFNEEIHESITHEHKLQALMAALAIKQDVTNFNNPTYYFVSVKNSDVPIFRSTSSDSPAAHATYEDTNERLGFARTATDSDTLYEGFLWGVPTLKVDDAEVPSVHLFSDYTDLYTSDVLIPLTGIAELFRHDARFAALTAELHELGFSSDSKRYEVPLYRDKKTGEVVYKNASSADIERIIGDLSLRPTLLFTDDDIWNSMGRPRPKGWINIS